jgi:anti-sigma B factor antagonist
MSLESNLESTVRHAGKVVVISLAGQLTFNEKDQLHELFQGLLDGGHKYFLLNLGGLKYLDSSGVGELVRSFCSIKKDGGDLKMMFLSRKVEEVLRITNSCFLLEDFTDENAALRSFVASV